MDIVDVAWIAGLSSATVSKVENSRQIPIVVTVRTLAEVLKLPIWFFGCNDLWFASTSLRSLEPYL